MNRLRNLWALLTRRSSANAQRRADQLDRDLAELRASVRALPPEQQAAFAHDIQAMIAQQARAHNDLSDALDDRHDR
ncbi:MAG: hypothetical protein U0Z44_20600 [Kouleothrix sp.]|nr:hypothetical protein [Kouleothrix sp.]